MEEAGYRCAIPSCKQTAAVEAAHIVPYAETQDNSFDNLIALCAVDHHRYDKLQQIPRASILAYKRNLSVINGRYNDFEQRMLEQFHDQAPGSAIRLSFGIGTDISVRNLLRDEMLTVSTPAQPITETSQRGGVVIRMVGDTFKPSLPVNSPGIGERLNGFDEYRLTDKGTQLVSRWFGAEPIDPEDEGTIYIEV